MIYRILFSLVVFVFTTGTMIPQDKSYCRITAVVTDSLTGKPIELVNLIILDSKDSALVKGGTTDSKGYFEINNIPAGSFFINVSCIGYRVRTIKDLKILDNQKMLHLDTIKLVLRNLSVGEVKVTGEKQEIFYLEDRIVFNVGKDVLSLGGSAAEVLEYAPLVKVDIDDNISMAGKNIVLISIDGIPLKDMGIPYKEYLKTTPASDIERIEIITDPPPEYGLMDNGGVINIIMKKRISGRYSGSVNGGAQTNSNYSSSLGLSYRINKLTLRGSISGNYTDNTSNSEVKRLSTFEDQSYILIQNKAGLNINLNSSFGFYSTYIPDKNNVISQTVFYRMLDRDYNSTIQNRYEALEQQSTSLYRNNINNNNNTGFFTYALSYARSFNNKGQKLNASVSYTNNLMKFTSDQYGETENLEHFTLQNNSGNKNNTIFFKALYSHPLGKATNFQGGYRMSVKNLNLMNDYYRGSRKDIWTNTYRKYAQQDHEIHLSYRDEVAGFEYGISSFINGVDIFNKDVITDEVYKYNFWGVYPSIGIRRSIDKKNSISLTWRSGSNYPMNRELNPHLDISDSSNLTQGNPNLKPGRYDHFYLWYQYNNLSFNASTGISHSIRKNIIESYTYLLNPRTNYTTFRNIGRSNGYSWYINIQEDLFKWWTAIATVDLYNRNYESETYRDNSFRWSANFNSRMKFSSLSFQTNFSYLPSGVTAQSKTKEYYFLDLGAKADIYGKRLYLYFKVKDLLNTTRNSSNTYGSGFISASSTHETTRIFFLGLTYYFIDTETSDMQFEDEVTDDF